MNSLIDHFSVCLGVEGREGNSHRILICSALREHKRFTSERLVPRHEALWKLEKPGNRRAVEFVNVFVIAPCCTEIYVWVNVALVPWQDFPRSPKALQGPIYVSTSDRKVRTESEIYSRFLCAAGLCLGKQIYRSLMDRFSALIS